MSPAPEPAAYRENRLDPVSTHPSKPSQVLQGGNSYWQHAKVDDVGLGGGGGGLAGEGPRHCRRH